MKLELDFVLRRNLTQTNLSKVENLVVVDESTLDRFVWVSSLQLAI